MMVDLVRIWDLVVWKGPVHLDDTLGLEHHMYLKARNVMVLKRT